MPPDGVPPDEIHAFMAHVRPGYRADPDAVRQRDGGPARRAPAASLRSALSLAARAAVERAQLLPRRLGARAREVGNELHALRPPTHVLLAPARRRHPPGGGRGLDETQPAGGWRPRRQHDQPRARARHGRVGGGGPRGAHRARDWGVETTPPPRGTRAGCRPMPRSAVHKNVAKKGLSLDLPLWKAKKRRPVTPEVAGSSPVARVSAEPNLGAVPQVSAARGPLMGRLWAASQSAASSSQTTHAPRVLPPDAGGERRPSAGGPRRRSTRSCEPLSPRCTRRRGLDREGHDVSISEAVRAACSSASARSK
jgi:hypothetical protein